MARYLAALACELAQVPGDFRPSTVFIGGGTPTALGPLDRMFALIRRMIPLDDVTEFSCEVNPGMVTPRVLDALREGGVNRISLGVQSLNNRLLAGLGRIHDADMAIRTYAALRAVGFDNINLDLMYGLPDQSLDDWRRDFDACLALEPDHLSAYGLSFEPGTPLRQALEDGLVCAPDEDLVAEQYAMLRRVLKCRGFEQVEISNFAQPERTCAHNLLYWGPGAYIGCGPAAHSHWKDVRYANPASLDAWCRLIETNASRAEERLTQDKKAREILIMWLRRMQGVPRQAFQDAMGIDYFALCQAEIETMLQRGWLVYEQETLRLADHMLFVSNTVFAELV